MNQHEHTARKQQKVDHKAKLVSSTLAQLKHNLGTVLAQFWHTQRTVWHNFTDTLGTTYAQVMHTSLCCGTFRISLFALRHAELYFRSQKSQSDLENYIAI